MRTCCADLSEDEDTHNNSNVLQTWEDAEPEQGEDEAPEAYSRRLSQSRRKSFGSGTKLRFQGDDMSGDVSPVKIPVRLATFACHE